MKKSPIPKKLKKTVIDAVQRHSWNMGVSNFVGDILYMSEDKEKTENLSDVHAEITVDRRYLRATFKIYPIVVKTWKKEGSQYLEEVIAHEVAHITTQHVIDLLTSCYKDEGETNDAWESLTQVVARLSLRIDKLQKK